MTTAINLDSVPKVADAILDRLVHNACRVELDGQSMRKKKLNNVDEKASN